MHEFLLYLVLALMIGAAVCTVVTDRMFTAVIYAGVLSAVAAFVYLLLGAPDVALAEAVIGSTLATVVFLATLRKYRVFTVYLTGQEAGTAADRVLQVISRTLQRYELEPHVLRAAAPARELLTRADCDLVVESRKAEIVIHGEKNSQYMLLVMEALAQEDVHAALEDSLARSIKDYKGDSRL